MNKLYSDLKIFHFSSKLKNISSNILSPPIHIRLKPTNKCNHHCFYCCYRNKNLCLNQLFHEKDEIPRKKMMEIIKDFKKMKISAVTFSGGGEPLCYPYIHESLEKLSAAKIKTAILTNGSLLKDKTGEIVGNNATWVRISMDASDDETYSKIRHVPSGEFDKICKNIYKFSKYKNSKCQLGTNYVVNKENYRDIYKFLKLMLGLGVEHVKISELVMSTEIKKNKKYHSYIQKYAKEQINKGLRNLSNKKFTIIDKFNNFKNEENCYIKNYKKCPFIQCLAVIAADMNVYTCQDKAYTKSGKIGSIRNKSFEHVWRSDETKKFIARLNPSKHCRHHCSQHKKNLMLLSYFNINNDHLEFV